MLRAFLLSLLVSSCMSAAEMTPSEALEDALWQHRVLLVHSPDSARAPAKAFLEQLKETKADLQDRDLIVIKADTALRQKFSMADGSFTLLLIGKDGGEKARQTKSVDLKALFALIDTMPMRRAEMKRK